MSLLNTHSQHSIPGASSPDGGVGGQGQGIVTSSPAANAFADRVAVISHELRNSLGVVRNAARLLRSQVDAARIERARTLIERHVDQMNRHIEQLLDPGRLSRDARIRCGCPTWICEPSWKIPSRRLRLITRGAAIVWSSTYPPMRCGFMPTLPAWSRCS